jgi:hypothetical protein
MSNVTECIDLYLYDENVTAEWFRAIIREAAEDDAKENEARVTYWRNLQEARAERERQGAA